jgi:ribonuclease HI
MGSAIIYSDGGCKPSRGKGGWGVHAEIGDKTYDRWGSFKYETTNNAMEIVAATKAIELAKEHDIKELKILSDSKQTLMGITKYVHKWVKNGWKKSDGNEVANRSEWEDLLGAVKSFESDECTITWDYVKAHNGDKGNEAADANASRGVILSRKGIVDTVEIEVDTKKWGKFKAAKYNRLFSRPYTYFRDINSGVHKSRDGRFVYYNGAHGKTLNLWGVRGITTNQSVLFLKEKNEVIDTVLDIQKEHLMSGVTHPVVVSMDAINKPKVHKELTDHGNKYLLHNPRLNGLETVDKVQLTEVTYKPLLAHRALDEYVWLEGILEEYLSGKLEETPNVRITDISDLLFGMSEAKKPKPILLKELTTAVKSIDAKISHVVGGDEGVYDMKLVFGIDLPTRNTLSAIGSEAPTVKLVTQTEGRVCFRYFAILETEDDACIYASTHSNLKMVLEGKK